MTVKKADDFGTWYQEIVVEAELISYYEVSGMAHILSLPPLNAMPSCR